MDRLRGKTFIVTGASSGFGRAIALTFAREGANVVCSSRRADPPPLMEGIDLDVAKAEGFDVSTEATHELIVKNGGQAKFISCDVVNSESVENMVRGAVDTYGELNGIVCNAGIYGGGAVTHKLTDEMYHRVFDTNVLGTWLCSKFAVEQMLKQGKGGTVLCSSSSSALNPYVKQAFYSMSKAAIAMMVRTMCIEYGRAGITVNALCPTSCKTPLAMNNYLKPEYRAFTENRVPLGRYGDVQDVANAALYLCSSEASYITGVLFPVDGGDINTVGVLPELDLY